MSTLFDTANGKILFNDQLVLKKGLTFSELKSMGFVYIREFDTKGGWRYRISEPVVFAGRRVGLSLGFLDGKLQEVKLFFDESSVSVMEELFEEHNDFLFQELGSPTRSMRNQNLYEYPWGSISSDMEIRDDISFIFIVWN